MPDGSTPIEQDATLAHRRPKPDGFEQGLLHHHRSLRAFACSMARDGDVADDLVQETMVRALMYRDKFDCGTNQRAWLFTILKNLFRTKLRKGARESELTDGIINSLRFSTKASQEDALFLKEVSQRLRLLPRAQFNAVIQVGALGHTIEDVARREGCPRGTIKSRVSRGRSGLIKSAL
ncbi:sigma-70 family RNA polymerase sigma factor [Rhodobacteraceae bacterium]|nr:sigma-70 family RNA polymerase sigma factor [Paracoccaceae bacterium]